MDDVAGSGSVENEVSVEVGKQHASDSPARSFCDAFVQTEMLDRLQGDLKTTREEKGKLAKEKDRLTKDSKRLQHELGNAKFDISKFKEKDEEVNFTLVFVTGMHLCFFTIICMTRHRTLIMAPMRRKTVSEQKLGRPRAMSTFEEFILTLMRLRLGLFQKDLAHSF